MKRSIILIALLGAFSSPVWAWGVMGMAGGQTFCTEDLNDFASCGTATSNGTNPDGTPGLAFDNNEATYFGFGIAGGDKYIQYAFGHSHTVSKVSILPHYTNYGGADHAWLKDFTIQISSNGTEWSTLGTGTHGDNANWEDFTYAGASASYIRILITSADWHGLYACYIKEVKVQ